MADSSAPLASGTSWSSYATFVEDLAKVNPDFRALHKKFANSLPAEKGIIEPSTQDEWLYVYESEHDRLTSIENPLVALESPMRFNTTRIVIHCLHFKCRRQLALLDRVALACNLQPSFVWQHLEDSSTFEHAIIAHSETRSLHLNYHEHGRISTVIVPQHEDSNSKLGKVAQ